MQNRQSRTLAHIWMAFGVDGRFGMRVLVLLLQSTAQMFCHGNA